MGSAPNWILHLPRKSGCFSGLEDEAVGFLPRKNRHLQVWWLLFLQTRAGDHGDTMKMWCILPVLLARGS